ncbi:MAG: hypothetical protein ABSE92_17520, partial [Terriglobales bacterium]
MNRSAQAALESLSEQDIALSDQLSGEEVPETQGEPQAIFLARLFWPKRRTLGKGAVWGLVIGLIVALLIPNTYEATVQLMPPDSSSLSGSTAMLGLLMGATGGGGIGGSSSGGGGGGLAGTVGELLGGQRPGPLFIGIMSSRTLSDRIIDR